MVVIKLKLVQMCDSLPMAHCWFCKSETNSALIELDGSEIWCCKNCHKKHGKVRRHTRLPTEVYSYKKLQITKGKSKDKTTLEQGGVING